MAKCHLRYRTAFFLRYCVLGFPAILVDVWLRYFSRCELVKGIRIVATVPETQKEFTCMLEGALTLIADSDKRRWTRVQREIVLIVTASMGDAIANYSRPLKVCTVDLRCFFTKDPILTKKLLASALIHEATHGALYTHRLMQTRRNHVRVERLCNKEAKRFLLRAGIASSEWDLYTDHDLKRTPLWLRLKRVFQEIKAIVKRDPAAEAEVWRTLIESEKDESQGRHDEKKTKSGPLA